MMIDGETVRKIRKFLAAALKTVERSRTGRAFVTAIGATTYSVGRVLHQLWLEVTGFTFLAIAGIGAVAGVREYGKYEAGHASGPGRLLLAVCFTISFAWFGISSFWRVSRKKLRTKT